MISDHEDEIDEIDEVAEILADPEGDTDVLNSDLDNGDQGVSAVSAPPATSASGATPASPIVVDAVTILADCEEHEVDAIATEIADNTNANPAKVSAPGSEPVSPAQSPTPMQQPADMDSLSLSQVRDSVKMNNHVRITHTTSQWRSSAR